MINWDRYENLVRSHVLNTLEFYRATYEGDDGELWMFMPEDVHEITTDIFNLLKNQLIENARRLK